MFYKQTDNVITCVLYLPFESASETIKADYQWTDNAITQDEDGKFVIEE